MTKALLIGLDGATFTVLDPYMERGVMPFLRGLVRRGARATLRSVMPPLTPPAWTSLMTGKRPGNHGVFDFFQKESPDSEYLRLADSQDIQSATIWSLASDHGLRVTALNFPVTFPAPAVNGCVVPGGWMPWRQLRLGCYPQGLFDRLKALPSFNAQELAMDAALEEKAVEGCAAEEYADWIALHTRREQRWFDVAHYLMREEPADLVGIVFDGVDKLQHLCWRFLDPSFWTPDPSAWELEMRARCEAYFRQLDGMIEELVDLAGPGASVIVASDHGGGPAANVFYLNTWLERQGYLAWAGRGDAEVAEGSHLGLRRISRHVYELDWDRTVAYAATPSSQGIQIVTRKPGGGQEMSPEEYRETRDGLVGALREARDPETGRPIVAEARTRDEVFSGPHEALAPDVSLLLEDGAAVSILRGDSIIRRRPEIAGNHRPEGILIAAGPGIRRGFSLDERSIVDVAPLVLWCLGLPIPVDLDGRLPEGATETGEPRPARQPVAARPVAASEAPVRGAVLDEGVETAILARLRALGYVE